MQDIAMVPGKPEGRPSAARPVVDEELADRLLGKAQTEGVELLGPVTWARRSMTDRTRQRLVLRKTMTGGRVRFRSQGR